jgi:hypothetical protein
MAQVPDDYLDANPFTSEGDQPAPDAPRRRLPVPHRQVWAALQDGLRNMPRIRESIVWSPEGWRWTWQYSCGDAGVAYLVPSERAVLGVLVVQEPNLQALVAHTSVSESVRELVEGTRPSGDTRNCFVPVLDVDIARDFLNAVRAMTEVLRTARACPEGQ